MKATNVFDSGLPIYEPRIILPQSILGKARFIENYTKGREFSFLIQGNWEAANGRFVLGEEIYIPAQEVSAASVDFLESLPPLREMGFNAILHAHPTGIDDFSSSDERSINIHFPCSLLYCRGRIIRATLSVPLGEGRLIIPLGGDALEIVVPNESLPQEELEKIRMARPVVTIIGKKVKEIGRDWPGWEWD